jgi:hypothetical protein
VAPVSKPAAANLELPNGPLVNRFFYFSATLGESLAKFSLFLFFCGELSSFSVHRSCYFVFGARWLMTSVLATRFSNLSGTWTSFRILEVSPNVAVRGSW